MVTVVIKNTKNKSWKQITTYIRQHKKSFRLLSKIQRTKVESKSQQKVNLVLHLISCYQKYKEQKLKANHNRCSSTISTVGVVIKNTKNKSWKQITTYLILSTLSSLLLSKIQRTKVESKSQLYACFCKYIIGCYQKYKEQKLKANHNLYIHYLYLHLVVIKNTKNKSWKQITTMMA